MEKLKQALYLNLIKDDRWQYLTGGLKNTLIITLFATLIGIALGLLIAIVRAFIRTKNVQNALVYCIIMVPFVLRLLRLK